MGFHLLHFYHPRDTESSLAKSSQSLPCIENSGKEFEVHMWKTLLIMLGCISWPRQIKLTDILSQWKQLNLKAFKKILKQSIYWAKKTIVIETTLAGHKSNFYQRYAQAYFTSPSKPSMLWYSFMVSTDINSFRSYKENNMRKQPTECFSEYFYMRSFNETNANIIVQ